MSNGHHTRIMAFFDAYADRFAKALKGDDDPEGTAAVFAGCFIEANPFGVVCGKNDEAFRKRLSKGYGQYRNLGTSEMSITSIESSPLDNNHYLATVQWHSVYRKEGREVMIDFSVIYLLQDIKNELRIFAYIAGDEQGALKAHGLIDA